MTETLRTGARLTAPVVFIGPPASGKSSVGKRVAKLLDLPFTDTDKVIVKAHGTIPSIFEAHGESHFRALERAAVHDALRGTGVVSLGGGAVLNADTQADLSDLTVIGLTIAEHAVLERVGKPGRPLLANGIEDWRALVAARAPLYRSLSSVVWDATGVAKDELAERIVTWLKGES